jgi:hypothetical protein
MRRNNCPVVMHISLTKKVRAKHLMQLSVSQTLSAPDQHFGSPLTDIQQDQSVQWQCDRQ